jgi:hypothetical protein
VLGRVWSVSRPAALVLLGAWLLAGCHHARLAFWAPPVSLSALVAPARAVSATTSAAVSLARPKASTATPKRQRFLPRQRIVNKALNIKPLLAKHMPTPVSTQPARPTRPDPSHENAGVAFRAGSFAMLGGFLVAVGSILLGLGLGGAWVLLSGAVGLLVGLLMGMFGLFGALSRDTSTGSRFNAVRLLGLVTGLSGLALGWYLGGLVGLSAGLLLLGLGSFLTGLGLTIGSIPAEPSPGQPVSK